MAGKGTPRKRTTIPDGNNRKKINKKRENYKSKAYKFRCPENYSCYDRECKRNQEQE